MAARTELEIFREATQLQMQCADHLATSEAAQSRRWELLRRVIEDAGKQFTSMRLDAVEARRQEEGAPLWWSVLVNVFVASIPLSAVTGLFFTQLTNAAIRTVKADGRTLRSTGTADIINYPLQWGPSSRGSLKALTDKTQKDFAKYSKLWAPEVHNSLVGVANLVLQAKTKPLFEQKSQQAKTASRTDSPYVAVTQLLHLQIDCMVRIEDRARARHREYIRDLFDIATAKNPAKEARAKEVAAATKENEIRVPYRQRPEPLPKRGKDALQELHFMRDELASHSSDGTEPGHDDLRSFQLMIESIMWATTYDFKPRAAESRLDNDRPAALPDGLWSRLIARYEDPDEGKPYKDVKTNRLGTKKEPYAEYLTGEARIKHNKTLKLLQRTPSPELRLSHYFSRVLLKKFKEENEEVLRTLAQLRRSP